MGNICDCFKKNGGTRESDYLPIDNSENNQVKGKSNDTRGTNYYQTIIDQTSENFINSKYQNKADNIPSREQAEILRSKLSKVTLSPSVLNSPPSRIVHNITKAEHSKNGDYSNEALNGLKSRPKPDKKYERAADEIAMVVNNNRKANFDNNAPALISFRPVEGTISSN